MNSLKFQMHFSHIVFVCVHAIWSRTRSHVMRPVKWRERKRDRKNIFMHFKWTLLLWLMYGKWFAYRKIRDVSVDRNFLATAAVSLYLRCFDFEHNFYLFTTIYRHLNPLSNLPFNCAKHAQRNKGFCIIKNKFWFSFIFILSEKF